MATTFRSLYKWLVPLRWLDDGASGSEVLWSVSTILDAFAERVRLGLEVRLPSRCGPSALLLTGQDRAIPRGRDETDPHYAARLKVWRYPRGHRTRGSAYALLEQVSEYWGGADCWTIDVNGNRYDRTAAGVESAQHGYSWTWDAGASLGRARFWINVDGSSFAAGHPAVGDAALWGGAFGELGYAVGALGHTSDDVEAKRRLFRGQAWKPAGSRAEWIVLSIDGSEPTPDATWDNWSANVAGKQTPTRSADHRYWSMAPALNNVYSGDATNYPTSSHMPSGATYSGSSASYPASAELYSGQTYAGDGSAWVASAQLVDDGSVTR